MKRLFAATAVLLLILAALFSCAEPEMIEYKFYVGGELYYSTSAEKGRVVQLPADPTVDGFIFDGWYIDEYCLMVFTPERLPEDAADVGVKVYAKLVEPPHFHEYTTEVIAPTCTERGYTRYTCECGDSYDSSYVDRIGHTYVKDKVIDPTCTKDGYTVYTCAACGHTYNGSYTEKGEHSYTSTVTPPTAEEGGYTTHTCTVCGDSYKDSYTDPKEHKYTTSITPPTCTERGYTTYTCTECGYTYNGSYTEPFGHSYTTTVTPPTCTAPGYTTYTCGTCGSSYDDDYTDVSEHSYDKEIIVPTCTEAGFTVYTCSVCGSGYTSDRTEPLGHSYKSEITLPTCTLSGYTEYTCTVCSDSYTDGYTSPKGHSYSYAVTEPTCTEMGFTVRTCTDCGDTFTGDYTASLGHDNSVKHDDEKHWLSCSRCSYTSDEGEHYSFADLCDYCGYVYPEGTVFYGYDGENGIYIASSYKKSKTGAALDLVIPALYNGKPVRVNISNMLNSDSDDVRSVTVSEGAYVMGGRIEGCDLLENLSIYGTIAADEVLDVGGCPALKRVIYPRGASVIGNIEFRGGLELLSIPASAVSFNKNYAISGEIEVFNYEGTLEEWLSTDGTQIMLTSVARRILIGGEELREVVIPEGIASIPDYAFMGIDSIESAVIPEGVDVIGIGAFRDCEGLKTVTSSAAEIGPEAFMGCKSLSALNLGVGLKTVGYCAFSGCAALTGVVLPDGTESIGTEAFLGCTGLVYAYVPASLTEVGTTKPGVGHVSGSNPIFDPASCVSIISGGDEGSAASLMSWTYTYIPYDGYKCTELVNTSFAVYYNRAPEDYFVSGDFAFIKNGGTADAIRYFGDESFVSIPEIVSCEEGSCTVTGIGNYIFLGKRLSGFNIPKSITNINSIFGADYVGRVTVDPESERYTVSDGVLYTRDMKTLIFYPQGRVGESYSVPESVTRIMMHAFALTDLKYVYAPDTSSVTYLSFVGRANLPVVGSDSHSSFESGFNVFRFNPSTTFVTGGTGGSESIVFDGDLVYIVKGDEAALLSYVGDDTELRVASTFTHGGRSYKVVIILHDAFSMNDTLRSVTLDEGFALIGNCDLGEVIYPEGFAFDGSFYTMGERSGAVFADCTALESITLPSSAKLISGLVTRCHALRNIDLGGVEYMTGGVVDCDGITSLTIPGGIKHLYADSVSGCDSLSELVIGTLGMTEKNTAAEAVVGAYSVTDCPLSVIFIGDEVSTIEILYDLSCEIYHFDAIYVGAGVSGFMLYVGSRVEALYYFGDETAFAVSGITGNFDKVYYEVTSR